MKNFGKILAFLAVIFTVASAECLFKCPSGKKAHPNLHFKKTFDGCGADGIIFNPKYLPKRDLEKCCNQHDICYSTCLMSKEYCDDAFQKCMLKVCGSGLCAVKCKANAAIFYKIAKKMGCDSYLKEQKKACLCQ